MMKIGMLNYGLSLTSQHVILAQLVQHVTKHYSLFLIIGVSRTRVTLCGW